MKKLLFLALSIALLISLASCGGEQAKGDDPSSSVQTPETPNEPTTEDPTTEDPTTEEPTTEEPTTEEPTTEDPTTEEDGPL